MTSNLESNDIELPSFIDRPDLQSHGQRTVSSVLAILGWVCWLYLFLPLLTLFGWAISYERVNQYIVHNKDGFFQQIELLGPIVIIMGMLLLLWAIYNLIRFRGVSRRTAPENTTVEDIAGHFKLDVSLVKRAQNQQVSVFYFDEQGMVTHITSLEGSVKKPIPQVASVDLSVGDELRSF